MTAGALALLLCVGLTIATVAMSGCGLVQSCTDAGCGDGIELKAPVFEAERDESLTLRACVDVVLGPDTAADGRTTRCAAAPAMRCPVSLSRTAGG